MTCISAPRRLMHLNYFELFCSVAITAGDRDRRCRARANYPECYSHSEQPFPRPGVSGVRGGRRIQPGRPGYVYFLEHRGFGAYKVGITNLGTNRLTAFQLRGWHILTLELFETGSHAQIVERAVKRWWRSDMGLPAFLGPADMPRTRGWSETIAPTPCPRSSASIASA